MTKSRCVIAGCNEPPTTLARIVTGDAFFSAELCPAHEAELDAGDLGWIQDRSEIAEGDERSEEVIP